MGNRDRNTNREDGDRMSENEFIGTTYTRSLLETMSESDLKQAEGAVNRHINALRSKNRKTHEYEIELCYIQDEMNRRAAAAAWAHKNEA